jgi:hypothetical protein
MDVAFRCMNRDAIDRIISRFVEWRHTSDMRGIITCMQNMEVLVRSRSSRLTTNIQGPLVNCTVFMIFREVVQEMKLSRVTFHLHLRLLATFRSELRSEPVCLSTSSFEHGLGCLRVSLYLFPPHHILQCLQQQQRSNYDRQLRRMIPVLIWYPSGSNRRK